MSVLHLRGMGIFGLGVCLSSQGPEIQYVAFDNLCEYINDHTASDSF